MANPVSRKLNVIRAERGDPGSLHLTAPDQAGGRDDAEARRDELSRHRARIFR